MEYIVRCTLYIYMVSIGCQLMQGKMLSGCLFEVSSQVPGCVV